MTNSDTKNFSQNVSSSYHLEDRGKCNKNTCANARNVPKLRFKGYNYNYDKIPLKNISTRIKRVNSDSTAPIMMISANCGFIMQSEKYSRDNAGKSLTKYTIIHKGELAYNHGASKAKPYGCCFQIDVDEARIPYVYHCFKIDKNNYAPYIALYLNNKLLERELRKLVSSSVRMDGLLNISYEDYTNIKLNLPKYEEQEKIASFLTLIDKKIEKQKELVELLKKYKRGLLSAIFSKKMRFKDDNGNNYPAWEEKRLENILKIKHGKSQKEIECKNGEYPILATGGEIGRTNSYLWDKPCVLIGRKGTIDKPQYMDTPFWTVDTLFYSEVFKENNAKYLYYLFNTINWKKYDESTGVPSLSAKTIERIKVKSSVNYAEQVAISEFLSKFDEKFLQEECILDKLQNYKKGLLQQMFI